MMMGLERIDRMRLFAAELTAPTSPAPRRLTGSSRAPAARRTGEPSAGESLQDAGLQGRPRQPSQSGSVGGQASSDIHLPGFTSKF